MGKGIFVGARQRVARLEFLEGVLLQAEPARIRMPEVGTSGERGRWAKL